MTWTLVGIAMGLAVSGTAAAAPVPLVLAGAAGVVGQGLAILDTLRSGIARNGTPVAPPPAAGSGNGSTAISPPAAS